MAGSGDLGYVDGYELLHQMPNRISLGRETYARLCRLNPLAFFLCFWIYAMLLFSFFLKKNSVTCVMPWVDQWKCTGIRESFASGTN
jgi:hypothetical protein